MDVRESGTSSSPSSAVETGGSSTASQGGYNPAVAGPGAWGFNREMCAALSRNWWAVALRGVFAILFGIVALVLPGVTIAALVLLFAAYMVADGVFSIIAAIRAARRHERWGWLVVEGIADFIAGAIAFAWPLITVLAFIYLMGVWGVVSGTMLAVAGFRLNVPHGRGWMLFGGIVSVIWGVLLFLWPITGALVLTWWMAGYALFFGAALLVLAFKLRARYRDRTSSGAVPQAT
jgi:uncharacterized membrane protein HdeD (DUF308 family)